MGGISWILSYPWMERKEDWNARTRDGKINTFEMGFKRFEFGSNGHMTVGGTGFPRLMLE